MLLRLDSRLDDTLNCVNALVLDGCVEDVEQVHGDGERVGVVGPPERIGDVGEEVGGLRGRGDDEMGRTEHGRPLGWGPGFSGPIRWRELARKQEYGGRRPAPLGLVAELGRRPRARRPGVRHAEAAYRVLRIELIMAVKEGTARSTRARGDVLYGGVRYGVLPSGTPRIGECLRGLRLMS